MIKRLIADRIIRKLLEMRVKKAAEKGLRYANDDVDRFFNGIKGIQPLNIGEEKLMNCIPVYQRRYLWQAWINSSTNQTLQKCGLLNQNFNNRY